MPDSVLTQFVRNGSTRNENAAAVAQREAQSALAELYRRHHPTAVACARRYALEPDTAHDLANEAFANTAKAVRAGNGPAESWRPYLVTAVQRTAAAWARSGRRTQLHADFHQWCDSLPHHSPDPEQAYLAQEEHTLVARSFRALPERWQAVLWLRLVDEQPAAEAAAALGLTTAGVSSLLTRAREGLREAYLQAHIARNDNDECRHYSGLLGATVRNPKRRVHGLDQHLEGCESCRVAVTELRRLNSRLGAVLPLALMPGATGGYLAPATAPQAVFQVGVKAAMGLSPGVIAATCATAVAAIGIAGALVLKPGDHPAHRTLATYPAIGVTTTAVTASAGSTPTPTATVTSAPATTMPTATTGAGNTPAATATSAPATTPTVSPAPSSGPSPTPAQASRSVPVSQALAKAFNNVGITNDSDPARSTYTVAGNSFSAQALEASGLTPGATLTERGTSFVWPAAAPGQPDNVAATGQLLELSGQGAGIALLAAATYGVQGGTGTVRYTDGSTSTYTLSVDDWYSSSPSTTSRAAVVTTYHNTPTGQVNDPVTLWRTDIPISPAKQVAALQLPDSGAPPLGCLHVFALAFS